MVAVTRKFTFVYIVFIHHCSFYSHSAVIYPNAAVAAAAASVVWLVVILKLKIHLYIWLDR